MTTTNGWPGKPGVPLNPEKDGWHWVRSSEGIVPALWARPFWRHCRDFWDQRSPEWMEDRGWRYLGPVLTPDEAAALQKRCEEAERERDALHRDASQEIATDELVRRLQRLGDWQAADRIEALQKRIAELEGALDAASRVLHKAGEQFSEYAKQHAAKGTAVSDLKADFNKQWAERCFSAYWRAAEGGKDE